MKVTVLIENTACSTNLKSQHGLSFYIDNHSTKILFDCGADGLFLENADKLGIDISAVDYLIISHGHYDHGCGLEKFLEANDKAKIILSKHAFNDYYFKVLFIKKYIGLNKAFKNNERIIFLDKELMLGSNMFVFSDITGEKFRSTKSMLMKRENGKLKPDDFNHEQCFIINDVLFAGCSHTGIVNIYEKAKGIKEIKHIFGGFHLFNPATKKSEDKVLIENIANEFKNENVKIYTGHCTGNYAFGILKSILGDKIEAISTGKSYDL
jgi:7,8-dihydropterin-6-yl-methyl-4-(beta-D-ribofuranosyl)aminobenzene 5'-phosphate synthase